MIDVDNILEVFSGGALWCGAGDDATDLAQAASIALERGINTISVVPGAVGILWPWLENKNVRILARFYLKSADVANIYDMVESINQTFKQGADGAQIFVDVRDLDGFVSQLYLIRDDLFFNKTLFVGMNISEIGPFDWPRIYAALNKLRATGLILAMVRDDGNASDFVGRVYAALNDWKTDFDMELDFIVGKNLSRIEQVQRLIQSMCPELASRVRFFINPQTRG